MTATIIPFCRTAEEAWEHFAALVAEANADPSLFDDEEHTGRRRAAHRLFERLFVREGQAAA